MRVKYAQVRFRNSERKFCYKHFLDLKKHDIVIVDSSNGVGIANVMEPDVTDGNITKLATAWILDKPEIEKLRRRITNLLA